ncbi:hypothetical protein VZT92_005636 [Zoarces viviparus]|uniref:Uncharacterized protein n=1 Tax=Zoarces viviparus TaxID=48416 RepID=A0AAW1FTZ2_ZOAVI
MLGFSGARRPRKKPPFLPLSVTPCPLRQPEYPSLGRFSEGYSVWSRVSLEERRENTNRVRDRGRAEPYGECRTEWMNAAETERLAPLPLAQTLPRRPVGRPQLP